MISNLPDLIFKVRDAGSFSETALKVFKFQAEKNPVYRFFVDRLGKSSGSVKNLHDIPFLPAEVFKNRTVIIENLPVEKIFESSGTTGVDPSRHYVHDLKLYETSFLGSFRYFYGEPSGYFIAALLPSYTERQNSSLVYMMNGLIRQSQNKESGFYDNRPGDLIRNIQKAKDSGQKTFLLGVSFALLDLANDFSPDLSGTIVMETGGMKGRRKEITREELHDILKSKFNVPEIHSEYGMTELISQAYSKGNGIFYCPTWMRILIRDQHDPLTIIREPGKTGGINVIDLANIYSCSFIATGDSGQVYDDNGFSVSGRLDNSDIRGCNLMVE
jgi:phenylacetate-coenzyme A ligase PaaK-like adenylate-forming protein